MRRKCLRCDRSWLRDRGHVGPAPIQEDVDTGRYPVPLALALALFGLRSRGSSGLFLELKKHPEGFGRFRLQTAELPARHGCGVSPGPDRCRRSIRTSSLIWAVEVLFELKSKPSPGFVHTVHKLQSNVATYQTYAPMY